MKKNLINNGFVAALIVLLTLASCGQPGEHAEHADTYTCPMHPTVISDRPGTCPVCGMDLVRKARAGEKVEITKELSRLIKSPNEVIVASIKTVRGEYKSVPLSVQAQGVVTYDTRNIYTIPARVSGRLENIALKYTFQQVSKGQQIARIYSPELITAQRELLFLLEHDPENTSLIHAAERKLKLLGLSANQISELIRTKEAHNTVTLYSPYSGYLITGQQAPSTTSATDSGSQSPGGAMGDGMASASPSPAAPGQNKQNASGGSLIREGEYVTAGQTLFAIINNKALRIDLDLPASSGANLAKGSKVELSFGEQDTRSGTVDFIQPFFTEGQEFLKVRVYTDRTDDLHIGHLVGAEIRLETTEGLWVPREAVIALGVRKVVFLKDGEVFQAKTITTGASSDGMIEITSGLASSDEIAANAHFMVDSESFIKTGD
jgi:Cu(I)/Ag(I) efflux system membrane fusion protein